MLRGVPALLVVDNTLAASATFCSLMVGIGGSFNLDKSPVSGAWESGLTSPSLYGSGALPFMSEVGDSISGNLNSDNVSDPALGYALETPMDGVLGTVAAPDGRSGWALRSGGCDAL